MLAELTEKLDVIKEYSAGMDMGTASYQRYIRDIERQLDTSKEEYTIAFVGMFNSGKSTVINSLLGPMGDARLSGEDRPDTAKRIRIRYRNSDQQAEAVLEFEDGHLK
ncbi:dynamin family protein [Neobacillus sp. SuZ13]|uniref:dynamin family protein n=1 Tax=Neobacillus sp. SuZ13 TaxID=3047875 RepID=UPI0024BF11F3|nr:dynamin family protein [Neobacillus sp. SuZ13]WHY65017.1 dynamin family protein [Neobacillus sp. SuZ13]